MISRSRTVLGGLGLGLVLLVGLWVNSQGGGSGKNEESVTVERFVRWEFDGEEWSRPGQLPNCTNDLEISPPVDFRQVNGVLWPGQKRGGDFKPHGGFRFDDLDPDRIQVRAPANGYVTLGGLYLGDSESLDPQYWIQIETACGILYRFDHLRVLEPKIAVALATLPDPKVGDSRGHYLKEPIQVERGEVLATGIGFKDPPNIFVDFGVYDVREKQWTSDFGWQELGPYGLCWFDLFDNETARRLRNLPTGTEGRVSEYCDLE